MMILPVLFILLFAKVTAESASIGDLCSLSKGSPGVCSLLRNCKSVFEELSVGNPPDTICGYSGFEPVVCCPTSAPTTTTTPKPVIAEDQTGDGRGSIARQKCEQYQQSVYTLRYLPPLLLNPSSMGTPINVSECAILSQKLIVGGTLAERKEFPHMAAVGFNTANSGVGWYCGGTLISKTFVLTAAHCTYSSNWGNATWVRVGDVDLVRTDDGASPVDRRITERIRHPQYKLPSRYHDIALLRLETRVPFNGWIRPACLHTAASTGTAKTIATGWGRVDWERAEGANALLKATLPLVDQQSCNKSYASDAMDIRLPNGIVEDLLICAGEIGKGSCQGDSGGPLVIYSKKDFCMYDVIGVASIEGLCGSSIPGVYTRVYNYVPWIESIVWPQSTLEV